MPTIGKPKPRFLKFVSKPANVGNVELSKAEPVYIDGLPEGGGGAAPAWEEVTDKPATFPPVIGTTETTAKAGDYVPTYAEISDKPATFPPETHTHTVADVTGLQDIINDLEQRVAGLESAAG